MMSRWTKVPPFAAVTLALALVAVACDGGGGSDEATPAVIRTAVAQVEDYLLTKEDAGEDWVALPDIEGTPDVTPGAEAILDRAFRAWAGCVGNFLAGGFVMLSRLAVKSSPRFADGSGRQVAGAVAIFSQPGPADEVVGVLDRSGEECGGLGSNIRVELRDVPAAPPDAAASYRMTATLETRSGTLSETFDLIVIQRGLVVSSLVFKGFGANDAGQAEIVARASAKLP